MTYLLISNSEDEIRKEISKLIAQHIVELEKTKAKKIEEIVHPDLHVLNGFEMETIGIADIRSFTRVLHKKPFKAPVHLGIIIGFEAATTEAQNAMLKELEDHPATVHYILGVVDENNILPTIRSRATTQYIGAAITQKEHKDLHKFVSYFLDEKEDILSAFAAIQKKEWKRQNAETFLSELYINVPKNKDSVNKLAILQKCGEYLRSNVSPKQVLTYLLFAFRHEV